MNAIFGYLARLIDSSDKSAMLHDAAYIVGVAFFIIWLNHGIYKGKGFTAEWNSTATTFAILIGGAQVTGLIVSSKKTGEKDAETKDNPN